MSTTVDIADACARARCAMDGGRLQYDEILLTMLNEIEECIGLQLEQPRQALYDGGVRAISVAFNIPPRCVCGRRRTRRYARARHALTKLLIAEGMTQPEIAYISGRHISSVWNSARQADHLLLTDGAFRDCFFAAQEAVGAVAEKVRAA